MGGLSGKHCRALLALALITAAALAPAAHADPFCKSRVVRDYVKPLEAMPRLRDAPLTTRLPFGPRNVFFGSLGQGPLVIGGGEIGFYLSYVKIATKPTGHRLDWLVTAKFSRIDSSNSAWEVVDSHQQRGISFPSEHRFAFSVSEKPAIYRIEVVFRDGSGRKLARYGQYFRVLRPTLDARLTLDETFLPGETIAPWLENFGTQPLSFGLPFVIEVNQGGSWTSASISPRGIWPAIGLSTGPGGAMSCWKLQIPQDAPAGLYRFVLQAETIRPWPRGRRTPITFTAEFRILPAV